jgi:hypothetical protein
VCVCLSLSVSFECLEIWAEICVRTSSSSTTPKFYADSWNGFDDLIQRRDRKHDWIWYTGYIFSFGFLGTEWNCWRSQEDLLHAEYRGSTLPKPHW